MRPLSPMTVAVLAELAASREPLCTIEELAERLRAHGDEYALETERSILCRVRALRVRGFALRSAGWPWRYAATQAGVDYLETRAAA